MPQENPIGSQAIGETPLGPAPEDATTFTGDPVVCRTYTPFPGDTYTVRC